MGVAVGAWLASRLVLLSRHGDGFTEHRRNTHQVFPRATAAAAASFREGLVARTYGWSGTVVIAEDFGSLAKPPFCGFDQ